MDGNHDIGRYSRIPTVKDLVTLCRNLNEQDVRYVIIGGFAVIRYGYIRATGDIDLLVENTKENLDRIRKALSYIPEGEAYKIADDDLDLYRVVRVSGEITVDLLGRACDVTYASAKEHIQIDEVEGVKMPYLKPEVLIKTKMGLRAKDVQDRTFLERILKQEGAPSD
jgi:predicted nucleotidyltransferase